MFDNFYFAIIKSGYESGRYDIFLLGSKASDWYSKGYISTECFERIQELLVPVDNGYGTPDENLDNIE